MMQVDSLPAQDCVVYTYTDMFIYLVWSVSLYGSKHIKLNWKKKVSIKTDLNKQGNHEK